MNIGLMIAVFVFVGGGQRFLQRTQALVVVIGAQAGVGEQAQKIRLPQFRARIVERSQALLNLFSTLLVVSVMNHHPTAHDGRIIEKIGQPVLETQGSCSLCMPLSLTCFSAILTQRTGEKLGKSQTHRIGERLSNCEGLVAPFQGLVRVAEMPQSPRYAAQRIEILKGHRPMTVRVVDRDRDFFMFASAKELA